MALFVQHGALSDSVSLPTVSLVSRRLSGLQQMTESCKVREKKLKGRETARILNCTICITLCYFLYCSSIATYREDINRGVVRKHMCRVLPDLKITEKKSSFSESQISRMQTCKPCVTFYSPDNERWLFCASSSFLKTGLISFKKEKTDYIMS